jgi:WD40 repeat protein
MTGKMIRELTVSEARTGIAISFTPDGRTLAGSYSSDDNNEKNSLIQLWDVATGERGRTFNSKKAEAEHLIFSNDGKLLLTLGAIYFPDSVELWDVVKGEVLHDFARFGSGISSINISPDNKVLVIGETSLSSSDQSSQIRLWSLTSGALIQTPIQGEFKTFNKDGTMFLTEQPLGAEAQRVTKLIVSSNGTELHSFNGTFLRLSNDGKLLFTDTPQGVVVWDATTGNKIRTLPEGVNSEQIQTKGVSPNGQYLAIVRSDSPKVELFSVETGNVLRTIKAT